MFLIPGDYIAVLGCRIGTAFMRAFLLPILSVLLTTVPPPPHHLSSHHPLLAGTSAPFGHYAGWLYSPELQQPASPSVHCQGSRQSQPSSGPGCLTALACANSDSQDITAQNLFVMESFGQAWWSRVTRWHFDT